MTRTASPGESGAGPSGLVRPSSRFAAGPIGSSMRTCRIVNVTLTVENSLPTVNWAIDALTNPPSTARIGVID